MNINRQHEKIECLHRIKDLLTVVYSHAFTPDEYLLKRVKTQIDKENRILEKMYEQ
jgi:hypothetical protein